ncbi:glycosyltransferase [uncultured Roseibium sp.]|uniref:glycosyltransferase n=1 Tax=uncultured Roseibium sp. TaxID=1936171 RepID=UPI003216A9BB
MYDAQRPSSPLPDRRPLAVHLSADYPTAHRGLTTTAVKRLVTSTQDADHVVFSLNRTSNPFDEAFHDCGLDEGVRVFAYRYFSPPLGIGLAASMRRVARRIEAVLKSEGLQPDVVHAHKFAFEGIAGLELVKRCGEETRLFVSVRGEAEDKVLRFKPHYRSLLQAILNRASRVYYVSAWFAPVLHAKLSVDPHKERLLANIVGNTGSAIPAQNPQPRFACVLYLHNYRKKRLEDLFAAFAILRRSHPGIGLDLIGGGDEDSIHTIEAMIAQNGLTDAVRILGAMDNAEITKILPTYLGMALPSVNETFGMAYLEALFAGIPILYCKNTGIDGYLDGIDAGIGVTQKSVPEIAEGLRRLVDDNAAFRSSLQSHANLLHERFDKEAIIAMYRADLLAGWTAPADAA